jgi:phage shock protein A
MLNRLKFVLGARLAGSAARAEDPASALDRAYAQQVELLGQVRAGVTQVAAARNQLQLQARRLEAQLVRLEEEARQALSSGHEDQARRALGLKLGVQQQLRDLDPQLALLHDRQQELTRRQQELAEQVARFRVDKEAQKARQRAAETLVTIGEATAGLTTDVAAANDAVRRANAETAHLEARAAAIDELVASGAITDERPVSAPADEAGDLASGLDVDRELDALRRELGPGTGA